MFNEPATRGQFAEHLSQTYVTGQSVNMVHLILKLGKDCGRKFKTNKRNSFHSGWSDLKFEKI